MPLCPHPIRQRLVVAHVADCSPGVRKVLESEWEIEAMSPGVADHNTLGIPQHASGWWQRTWRIVLPGCAKFLKANGKLRQYHRELRMTSHREYPNTQRVVAAHVVDCFPSVRKVLKSEWNVEAIPPGVADHITLEIPQCASGWWLRTWRIVLRGCASLGIARPLTYHFHSAEPLWHGTWKALQIPCGTIPNLAAS